MILKKIVCLVVVRVSLAKFYIMSCELGAVDISARLYLDVLLTNTGSTSTARGLLDRRSADDSVW
jgi:hypothetical protein